MYTYLVLLISIFVSLLIEGDSLLFYNLLFKSLSVLFCDYFILFYLDIKEIEIQSRKN